MRELDERLGFGELIQQHLTDSRRGRNKQFAFVDLLRQSVYSRLAGYEDLNDAGRLSQDTTFRLISSLRGAETGPPCGQWRHGGMLTRLTVAFSGIQM